MDENLSKIKSGTHVLIPKWEQYMRYIALISLVSLIYSVGVYSASSKGLMFDSEAQKAKVVSHTDEESTGYKSVHRTLKEDQKEFITRAEWEFIREDLSEIKDLIREDKKNE